MIKEGDSTNRFAAYQRLDLMQDKIIIQKVNNEDGMSLNCWYNIS